VAYAQHFQEMYREQVISLEDDLARLREQDDLKSDDFNVSLPFQQDYWNHHNLCIYILKMQLVFVERLLYLCPEKICLLCFLVTSRAVIGFLQSTNFVYHLCKAWLSLLLTNIYFGTWWKYIMIMHCIRKIRWNKAITAVSYNFVFVKHFCHSVCAMCVFDAW